MYELGRFPETIEMPEKQRKYYLWRDAEYKNLLIAMRSIFLVIALFICHVGLHAQDRYFLYVQTDNEQAFYARVQGRTLSSSASGYLILPRISDSSLTITIGFPKRLFPEQTFQIRNIRSDKGFFLKNASGKGWMLTDMQTSDQLLATSADAPRTSDPPSKSSSADPFSELLSTVIDDSTLSETPIVRNTPAAPTGIEQEIKPRTNADSVAPRVSKSVQTSVVSEVQSQAIPKPDDIASQTKGARKILEQIDATGVQLVFSDENSSEKTDTISVWIPKDKSVSPAIPAGTDMKSPSTGVASQASSRFIPDRSDCKSFINAKDLGLLRRRMEALTDEDAKVALAQRSFREACFSTEQVRSLLMVFGREEGRFKLLDVAYSYVLDPSKFAELESVLKDTYFIYRFRKKTSAPPQR